MKKRFKLLLLSLILPLGFSFTACKKKTDNTGTNNNGTIEQPSGGDDGSSGSGGSESANLTYNVLFDYNLPGDYAGILTNFTVSDIKVNTSTTLARVPNSKLQPYFLGWTKEGSSDYLTDNVTSSESGDLVLKGNWDVEKLEKYYYSDGVSFEILNNKAVVSSWSGISSKVIISKNYVLDDQEYDVASIDDNVFENSAVENVVIKGNELEIGGSAFKNSKLSQIDFSKISSIGDYAFEGTNIESVTLSSEIGSLGNGVFKNCLSLTSFNFSGLDIGISEELFSGCTKLSSITGTEYINSIGAYSFAGCVSITSLDFISTRVFTISEYSFNNCTGLTDVTLPENIINLYGHIFDGCTNLTSLTVYDLFKSPSQNLLGNDTFLSHIGLIGDSLKSLTIVGSGVNKLYTSYFYNMTALETFVMSNSIETIEDNAFNGCENLKNITLSNNLTSFTYKAFSGTAFLAEFDKKGEVFIYNNKIIYVPKNIDVSKLNLSGVVSIEGSAFSGNQSLTSITIPASVTEIKKGAFNACSNLTEVIFEQNSSITTIDKNVFNNCLNLESVDLTNLTALTTIDDCAFLSTDIKEFCIPETVTKIGVNVFGKVSKFKIVKSDGSEISENTKYKTIDGVLYEKLENDKLKLVRYPINKAGDLFICPEEVTELDCYAFSGLKNLNYIYFKQTTSVNSVEWPYSASTVYNSFVDSDNVKIFAVAGKDVFELNERSDIYRKINESNDTLFYDSSENTIKFAVAPAEGFVPSEGMFFIHHYENEKITIVYFEIEKQTGDEGNVYIVKNLGSFETDFTS